MLELDFSKPKGDTLDLLSSSDDIFAISILNFLNSWWSKSQFIISKTSGSTGAPKEIILEKTKVVNSALATGDFFSFKTGNSALLCMSPEFIAGKMMIVRADIWKLKLLCVEPSKSPIDSLPLDINIDFAAMVPLQLKNSIKYLNSGRISKLLVGGGAVDSSLSLQLKNVETQVYSSYGMTETITHVAIKKLNGNGFNKFFCGLEGVKFKTDERDCLIVNAPKISDQEFVTNDIVELKNDREFVWLGANK